MAVKFVFNLLCFFFFFPVSEGTRLLATRANSLLLLLIRLCPSGSAAFLFVMGTRTSAVLRRLFTLSTKFSKSHKPAASSPSLGGTGHEAMARQEMDAVPWEGACAARAHF